MPTFDNLVVRPPLAPMLAKLELSIPEGEAGAWHYEPKWDGFRTIVFRDGDDVELGSRNERPMTRYFPEVVSALKAALPQRCVLDGEIVVVMDGRLEFDALQQRIHPADSRVRKLADETPAWFIAFDLLALGDVDLRRLPTVDRRRALLEVVRQSEDVRVTPATGDPVEAREWFDRYEGLGCDGIIAKRSDGPYIEDKRVMVKVKHRRTADCAVAGFRWHKDQSKGPAVGSLLLGLYDAEGRLNHVGVTASFTERRRRELVEELAPYRENAVRGHPWEGWIAAAEEAAAAGQRLPGAKSRWNAKKDLSFEPLRLELVCEVAYDYLQSDRFRHATTFVRWRPDRDPSSCAYSQLGTAVPSTIDDVFGDGLPG